MHLNTPELSWSTELQASAQTVANKYCPEKELPSFRFSKEHSSTTNIGENVAWGEDSPEAAVASWYAAIAEYKPAWYPKGLPPGAR